MTSFCHLSLKSGYNNLLSYQCCLRIPMDLYASSWNHRSVLSFSIWLIGNSNLVYLVFPNNWRISVSFIYLLTLHIDSSVNCLFPLCCSFNFFKWILWVFIWDTETFSVIWATNTVSLSIVYLLSLGLW